MKKLATLAVAATFTVGALSAHAGGMSEPMIEAPVVVEESSSSGNNLIPLLLVGALVAAVVASSD